MKAAEYQYKRVYVCMRCGLRMTSVVRMHTQIYKLTRYSHLQEYIQYMNSITFILYIMSYCLYEIQPKNRLEKIQNNSYLKIKWNKIEQNRNMTNMNQCDALSLSLFRNLMLYLFFMPFLFNSIKISYSSFLFYFLIEYKNSSIYLSLPIFHSLKFFLCPKHLLFSPKKVYVSVLYFVFCNWFFLTANNELPNVCLKCVI